MNSLTDDGVIPEVLHTVISTVILYPSVLL